MRMHTLRTRLVVSNIVPFLLTIPLVGIVLIYVLESQVLLPGLGAELRQQSALVSVAVAYDQFQQLRDLILIVLLAGLLLGGGLGLGLALQIERPLRETTQAIDKLAGGRQLTPLPEQGPQELRTLRRAFNTLAK